MIFWDFQNQDVVTYLNTDRLFIDLCALFKAKVKISVKY